MADKPIKWRAAYSSDATPQIGTLNHAQTVPNDSAGMSHFTPPSPRAFGEKVEKWNSREGDGFEKA